jgi:predicted nucleic acid-binding protein
MTGPIFVDTNVFIYAVDLADPQKQQAAQSWLSGLWKTRRGRLSLQVIHEFYAKVCRKNPSVRDQARAEARALFAWRPVPMDTVLVEDAWKLQDRYQLSFWDALIVAAAKSITCSALLTEDLQSGQDFDGVLVVNPFTTDTKSIL